MKINTRIVTSLLTIGTAGALLVGATFAFFSSSASSNGNTFTAGSLSLDVTPDGGTSSSPAFTFSDIVPGTVIDKAITLTNNGSIAAATTKLVNITHSTGTSPDLGDKLTLDIYNDVNGNGIIDGGDTVQGSAHITDGAWSNIDLGFGLAVSGNHKIVARVTFDSDSGNTFQGANSTFNLNFEANQ